MATQVVRPRNRKEFMDKLITPYDTKEGNPNQVFSEPSKLGQPEQNRAYEMSLKGDTDKDFYIGIKDIDEAVMYYFNNVLKLSVVQNNVRINVPVIYGTPEYWKTIQADGYYRDENGKMMAPLLMFKRRSVTQNRELGNKLDGNSAHNVQAFETKFNRRNIYNNFSILNNKVPETKYVVSVTPDYITVEYECVVWTYFVEQMDKLIEAINFASRSYWGDPNRFQFLTSIESFEDSISYAIGENRAVRTNFNMTLNGYLIPDSINKQLASKNLYYGISQVVFGLEIATTDQQFDSATNSGAGSSGIKSVEMSNTAEQFTAEVKRTITRNNVRNILLNDSVNNVNITTNNYNSFDPLLAIYLDTSKSVTGTVTAANTVTFANAWLTAPSPLAPTSVADFVFYVNGQYVEPTSIVSFTNGSTLVVDVNLLGYSLEATDVVVATGKFA